MATQYEFDIPFSATHQQQAFKLLELPPELLALLESDAPPTYARPLSPSAPSPKEARLPQPKLPTTNHPAHYPALL
jgi:hypothetical protein